MKGAHGFRGTLASQLLPSGLSATSASDHASSRKRRRCAFLPEGQPIFRDVIQRRDRRIARKISTRNERSSLGLSRPTFASLAKGTNCTSTMLVMSLSRKGTTRLPQRSRTFLLRKRVLHLSVSAAARLPQPFSLFRSLRGTTRWVGVGLFPAPPNTLIYVEL